MIKRWGGEKSSPAPKKAPPPVVTDLEKRLEASLETEVKLKHGKKGGTVTIRYYSDEELDKLLERLL